MVGGDRRTAVNVHVVVVGNWTTPICDRLLLSVRALGLTFTHVVQSAIVAAEEWISLCQYTPIQYTYIRVLAPGEGLQELK